ncbi:MAG: adenosylcobinamide amidohydrolase [Candidatus Bathyarchaeota archaeon]|nr:adenosylcobinamide amidohydrolase [Candidatus Bathyarchaeota archaeon]
MKEINKKLSEKKIDISLAGVSAKVVYHIYKGYELNTLVVSFGEKRRVLSTLDGFREVPNIANNYTPLQLSMHTAKNFREFKQSLPLALGIDPALITFLSTGVNMDQLAVCERSYEGLEVCCLATAGAKGNALRTGVEVANYVEQPGYFVSTTGTINVIVLTNSTLSGGAMARAIVTVTEAKTAALQDLNVRSTSCPQYQATGTGTDNVLVVSGTVGEPLLLTSGHVKLGELIGTSTKIVVAEALEKHDGV